MTKGMSSNAFQTVEVVLSWKRTKRPEPYGSMYCRVIAATMAHTFLLREIAGQEWELWSDRVRKEESEAGVYRRGERE